MHVAIIIGGSLVCVGAFLYIHHRLTKPEEKETASVKEESKEECCGKHEICERFGVSLSDEIIYFDDEELDAFAGFDKEEYSKEDIELFRDVLMTLRPEEIAEWSKSIEQRGITLPEEIRDEMIILLS